jgi:hypothetical protein
MSGYEDNEVTILNREEIINIFFSVLELDSNIEIKEMVLNFLNRTLPFDPIDRFIFISSALNPHLSQEIVIKTIARMLISLTSFKIK